MDKKIFNKSSNFFKKEGFYVILFVCLCVVATVAAISTKKNTVAKTPVKTQVAKTETKTQQPTNAMQVNNGSKPVVTVPKNTGDAQKSSAVSSTNNSVWGKPVDGKLIMGYSEHLVDFGPNRGGTNLGQRYECKANADVAAVLDGKVISVTKTVEGETVILKHNNGYETVYSNLQTEVAVKEGQQVQKGQKIGKVGNTTTITINGTDDKFFFQVLKILSNGRTQEVDPAKFIKQ